MRVRSETPALTARWRQSQCLPRGPTLKGGGEGHPVGEGSGGLHCGGALPPGLACSTDGHGTPEAP
eukprot:13445216-Alexandrium_andersonii.AAC.1